MGFLIAGLVAVGAWFLIHKDGAAPASIPAATTLPLSSGSAPVADLVPMAEGSLDRFLGPPVRIPSPMQRAIAPETLATPGVIAQLQRDTTAQRLARFYGPSYPTRYARNLE